MGDEGLRYSLSSRTQGSQKLIAQRDIPRCISPTPPVPSVFDLLFVISSIRERLGRENRQRVILIVHLRLNMLTRLDVSHIHGGEVDMQPHLFAVLSLDETVIAFDAQYFALDRLLPF